MARKKHSGLNLQDAQRRAAHLKAAKRNAGWHEVMAGVVIAHAMIDQDSFALEPSLSASAWVEYQYLSAFERTERFTAEYEKLFRRKHAQYFDLNEAERARPINASYVMNSPAEMTALWHARQQADLLGMPYDIFLTGTMEVAIEDWSKKRVPRPNQLWGDSQLAGAQVRWDGHKERWSHMPREDTWDRRFRADAYRGDPAQEACLGLIEERLAGVKGNDSSRAMTLSNFLWQGWIGLDEASRRFGSEVADEAVRGLDDYVQTSGLNAAHRKPYRPSCLGIVSGQDRPECQGCKFREMCAKVEAWAAHELTKRYGSTNPRLDRKRRDTRERVRRHREKRRQQEALQQRREPSSTPLNSDLPGVSLQL